MLKIVEIQIRKFRNILLLQFNRGKTEVIAQTFVPSMGVTLLQNIERENEFADLKKITVM